MQKFTKLTLVICTTWQESRTVHSVWGGIHLRLDIIADLDPSVQVWEIVCVLFKGEGRAMGLGESLKLPYKFSSNFLLVYMYTYNMYV